MTRSPNDDGDEVTRQKLQAMAKDGTLGQAAGRTPAVSGETGPALRPGFLSTDQYNLGVAIVSGDQAPLAHDPPRPAAGTGRRTDRVVPGANPVADAANAAAANASRPPLSEAERAARNAPTDVHGAEATVDRLPVQSRRVPIVIGLLAVALAVTAVFVVASRSDDGEDLASVQAPGGTAPLKRLDVPTGDAPAWPTGTATAPPVATTPAATSTSSAITSSTGAAAAPPTARASAAVPASTTASPAATTAAPTATYDPGDLMFKREKKP